MSTRRPNGIYTRQKRIDINAHTRAFISHVRVIIDTRARGVVLASLDRACARRAPVRPRAI